MLTIFKSVSLILLFLIYDITRSYVSGNFYDQPTKFIHIPKTGGTSVEILLLNYGIRVGYFAWRNEKYSNVSDIYDRTYPINSITEPNCSDEDKKFKKHLLYRWSCGNCSSWHSLPKEFMPRTFAIVREPKARLLSQFCFTVGNKSIRTDPIFRYLNFTDFKNYSNSEICQKFNEYVTLILDRYNIQKNINVQDCHFIPQWYYAKHAEHIIPFRNINTPDFANFLSNMFNVTIATKNIKEVLSHKKHQSCKISSVKRLKFGCLNSTNRQKFEYYSSVDYKHLSKYF